VIPSAPWHPGQSLSLLWVPSVAQGGPEPPRSVTCQFSLYGPYDTYTAAHADQSGQPPGSGVPLAAYSPPRALSTDRATSAPTPVAYVLPDALAPGYYVAFGVVGAGDSTGSGSSVAWVVEVV
jgi:hypothetical protein